MSQTVPISTEVRLHETAAHDRVLEYVLSGAIPHDRRLVTGEETMLQQHRPL